MEKKRQKCEVYSRVVGYYRPVEQWNEGKQAEFVERKEYDLIKNHDKIVRNSFSA